MSLAPGSRLGPYDVVAAIGAGGMGEVCRARATKLDRDVASKILPDTFAADPDRVARFQREVKTLVSLNHPHIGAIYGFEESTGVKGLVLEFVEGPTLAERIAVNGSASLAMTPQGTLVYAPGAAELFSLLGYGNVVVVSRWPRVVLLSTTDALEWPTHGG